MNAVSFRPVKAVPWRFQSILTQDVGVRVDWSPAGLTVSLIDSEGETVQFKEEEESESLHAQMLGFFDYISLWDKDSAVTFSSLRLDGARVREVYEELLDPVLDPLETIIVSIELAEATLSLAQAIRPWTLQMQRARSAKERDLREREAWHRLVRVLNRRTVATSTSST